MLYLLVKSAHILAIITWISGMVGVALFLAYPSASIAKPIAQWDRKVTSPAMMLAWVLGLALAYMGGWFGDGWLWAKLVAVFLLSGLHGALSGKLRRVGASDAPEGQNVTPFLAGLFGFVVVIVVLVVTKPF